MDLYPSIDVRGGRCVRLLQGDYDREIVYDADPVDVARGYAEAGAPWIHVVDLDAARTGRPENRSVVAAIASAVSVPVQAGGGVRDDEAAGALFDAGVARVVVGTAAMEDPAFLRRLAGARPVALGLDVRGRSVAVRGWEQDAGRDVADALDDLADAGVEAVVVTQIQRDGLLGGPDLAGLESPVWVYFVHSYAPDDLEHAVATCEYGGTVVAAVERGSVWAAQFHPEKSGATGLRLLRNFVDACG